MTLSMFFSATPIHAEQRQIAFWPNQVPDAIHANVNGQAALESVRSLGRFHRVHGSPSYAAAAEWMRSQATQAGLSEVKIESFPADGKTRYAHFLSYLGWDAKTASLEEVTPHTRLVARFPESPVALADYSQTTNVSAALVDIGTGSSAKDFFNREVRGRIVLASGPLPLVHQLAVEERGALGIVSDFPNQTTAWSGDDQDLVRWGHLSPYHTKNTFAFMLSKRQAQEYRQRLAVGENITVRASVQAQMQPANFDVVSAVIPGSDPLAGEVILTAHLCHQSAGANDNASGSAAILEVARSLQQAIKRGQISAPRMNIRFLWTPEIAGSQAWLSRHPDIAKRLVAGIHMDMVGALLNTTHSTFHLSRSAASLPHVINDIGEAFFDQVVKASALYAERGGDAYAGFVTPGASRDMFLGDVRAMELGSDHEVFQAVGFGIPMLYFHDWPDVTIHTNKDQPENLDSTKLGRVVYLGAATAYTLAALPASEAPRLLAISRAQADKDLAQARLRAALTDDAREASLAIRESYEQSKLRLQSFAHLWPTTSKEIDTLTKNFTTHNIVLPAALKQDRRIPLRKTDIRGPLHVYYYDHLSAELKQRGIPLIPNNITLPSGDNELMEYEAFNLADGKRNLSDISDILTGRYSNVPVEFVQAYFERLSKAGVIFWK